MIHKEVVIVTSSIRKLLEDIEKEMLHGKYKESIEKLDSILKREDISKEEEIMTLNLKSWAILFINWLILILYSD